MFAKEGMKECECQLRQSHPFAVHQWVRMGWVSKKNKLIIPMILE